MVSWPPPTKNAVGPSAQLLMRGLNSMIGHHSSLPLRAGSMALAGLRGIATSRAAVASRASLAARSRSVFAVRAAASPLIISNATRVVVSLLDSMRVRVGLKMSGSAIRLTGQSPLKKKAGLAGLFQKSIVSAVRDWKTRSLMHYAA